jgi:hypothetical protein
MVAEPSLKGVELARRSVVGTKLEETRGDGDLYRLQFELVSGRDGHAHPAASLETLTPGAPTLR